MKQKHRTTKKLNQLHETKQTIKHNNFVMLHLVHCSPQKQHFAQKSWKIEYLASETGKE